MDIKELEYKEAKLRQNFAEHLDKLDVDGNNNICDVKEIKLVGVLWHLTHQLLMAEKNEETKGSVTTAQTMNIQATGLAMRGR